MEGLNGRSFAALPAPKINDITPRQFVRDKRGKKHTFNYATANFNAGLPFSTNIT